MFGHARPQNLAQVSEEHSAVVVVSNMADVVMNESIRVPSNLVRDARLFDVQQAQSGPTQFLDELGERRVVDDRVVISLYDSRSHAEIRQRSLQHCPRHDAHFVIIAPEMKPSEAAELMGRDWIQLLGRSGFQKVLRPAVCRRNRLNRLAGNQDECVACGERSGGPARR